MLNTIQQDILFDDRSVMALLHGKINSFTSGNAHYNDCTNNFNDCTNNVYASKIVDESHNEVSFKKDN